MPIKLNVDPTSTRVILTTDPYTNQYTLTPKEARKLATTLSSLARQIDNHDSPITTHHDVVSNIPLTEKGLTDLLYQYARTVGAIIEQVDDPPLTAFIRVSSSLRATNSNTRSQTRRQRVVFDMDPDSRTFHQWRPYRSYSDSSTFRSTRNLKANPFTSI